MSRKSKGQFAVSGEWAKQLRAFFKRQFRKKNGSLRKNISELGFQKFIRSKNERIFNRV